MRPTLRERLLANRIIDEDTGCWIWTRSPDPDGYSRIRHGGRRTGVHVASYELFVGPVPDGLQVDHRCHKPDGSCPGGNACRHRLCFNPDHLKAVPPRENVLRGMGLAAINARKEHCKNDHPFDLFNTYFRRDGKRACRECQRERNRAWRFKKQPPYEGAA